jgi:hypothetical protein
MARRICVVTSAGGRRQFSLFEKQKKQGAAITTSAVPFRSRQGLPIPDKRRNLERFSA